MPKEQHFTQAFTRSGYAVAAILGFRAVKHATTGTEDMKFNVAGAGEEAAGIAIGDADSGGSVGVAPIGFGMAHVNGLSVPIAAGDKLKPAANGILVKAGAGDKYIAEAWEPATADGLDIRVWIQKGQLPA